MFQKSELKMFRQDFAKAVEGLEKKYDVKIELGSISYTDENFKTRLTATRTSAVGKEKKVDPQIFAWLKEALGFEGNIGDSYTDRKGITYTIYDLDGKKPKFPVLLRGSDGKNYKAPVDSVNMLLANQAKKLV